MTSEMAGGLIILIGSVIMIAVTWVAFRGMAPLSRRFWGGGILLHGIMVAAIVICAYTGTLPWWVQGRTLSYYDTFMHFYLTGLLTFFLEGLVRPRPFALGRCVLPRMMVIVLALSAFDEVMLQPLASNRSSTLHDLAGNAVGAILFGYLGYFATGRQGAGAAR